MTSPPVTPGPDQPYTLSQMMPAPVPESTGRRPRRKRAALLIGAAVAAIAVLGFGAAAVIVGGGDPIPDAQEKCDTDGGSTRVSDGGQTVAIQARESRGVDTVRCVLDELGAPTAVLEKMSATRALDGREEAEWGDYSASWTYHPDAGLNLVITTTG